MGGPSSHVKNLQVGQAQIASNESLQALGESGLLYSQSQEALSPTLSYYKSLTGGNPLAITREIAPSIAQASANEESAKRSIEANVPRGGAQQLAEAELPIETAATVSGEANQAYQNAFTQTANLGLALGSGALGEQGVALAGTQTAAQTYGQIGQEEAQGKAATMGFLGSVSHAAGTAAA